MRRLDRYAKVGKHESGLPALLQYFDDLIHAAMIDELVTELPERIRTCDPCLRRPGL